MTGSTQEDYADMMLGGGRSVEGNRSKSGHEPGRKPAPRKAAAKSAAKSKASRGAAAKHSKKVGSKRG